LLGGISAAISLLLLLLLCSLEVCDDVFVAVEGGSATGTAALVKPWFVVELEGLIVVKFYWFGYLGCVTLWERIKKGVKDLTTIRKQTYVVVLFLYIKID
jgi:hypothetical protein